MFEQEAETKVVDYIIKSRDCLMKPCKTLEDCQHQELDFEEAVKLFRDGAEFGYNKANEWHRIDEGKYPNKESLGKSFIVAFAFNEKTQEYYSFDCAEYIDKEKFITHTSDGNNKNNADKIIAWKEIILPKSLKG